MKSPEMATSGRAARTFSIVREVAVDRMLRFIAFKIESDPDCTGRWQIGHQLSISPCAAISSVMSAGWLVV